jgi:hypothetical protein
MGNNRQKRISAMNEDTLIAITMFAAIFGVVYVIVTSRHRQRMALIEKGMTPADFVTARPTSRGLTLKFGMLMVGLGVGILSGYILNLAMPAKPTEWDPHPEENPAFYFLSILIFGGLALIAEHWIASKKKP